MADGDFDLEAYLDAQVQEVRNTDAEHGNGANDDSANGRGSSHKDKHRESDGERDRDKDRDRDRHKERKRSRSRRRSRSRSRSRRRSDSRGGRRRRSRDRSHSRRRRRSRDRSDRRRRSSSRDRHRGGSPDRKTAEDGRKKDELNELEELTKDQRTVFVSQLVMKTTDQNLREYFGQLGQVKSIVMIRDKNTGRHKGAGYVEMGELEAIPMVLQLNGTYPPWQPRFPILVKASEAEKNFIARKEASAVAQQAAEDKGLIRNLDNRLYLGNLHVNITESDLQDVVKACGEVEHIHLHRDELGTSKGYAFVTFARADDAHAAMQRLAGLELVGKPIKIGLVTDHSNSVTTSAASANWRLDDDEGTGMIMNAQSRVMLMAKLGQTAGINIPNPAVPYIGNTGPLLVPNQTRAPPAPVAPPAIVGTPSVCIKIKNMFDPAEETQEGWDQEIREDVGEECSNHGAVVHIYVEARLPGGLVFVKFGDVSGAQNAAQALNGRFFAGRMISVEFLSTAEYSKLFPDA